MEEFRNQEISGISETSELFRDGPGTIRAAFLASRIMTTHQSVIRTLKACLETIAFTEGGRSEVINLGKLGVATEMLRTGTEDRREADDEEQDHVGDQLYELGH